MRTPALVSATAGIALLAYGAHKLATSATAALRAEPPAPSMSPRGAVVALSHGGGPMPVLGDPDSAALAQSLRTRVPAILGLDDPARRPRAIVLVTAHWSTETMLRSITNVLI